MYKKAAHKTFRWYALPVMGLLLLLCGCSTKKNTAGVRFYHATTARFNTFYNGQVAFLQGAEAQYKGHKDDYTRLIPMYPSTAKSSQALGKSNFETAITKCEKAIKVHSIKKRPETKGNKRMSPKEKQYMARKEFNPFLYKAWLLMAESQFRKGDFIECASTCNYIMRLYHNQPEVSNVARALLARCYVALEWPYDAEDVLSKMSRDSLSLQALREKEETQAAYFIETGQYAEAIPLLERSIKHADTKLQRSRLKFLLGQLYYETGNLPMAYKSYGRVIRSNPPYEMAFTARIKQTEAVTGDRSKQMIGKLRRMAKSDKNKDYLDQIYYAMGNIYLGAQDTARAIGAYEKGAEESKGNSIAKAVLLLKLSEIYWGRENYIDAARTYQGCLAALSREHEQYDEVKHRSDVLKALEPHLSAIKLQDSLQALAKMDEAGRNAAIDRVIEALKKKEKEEAKKKAAAEAAERENTQGNKPQTRPAQTNQGATKGEWYFYNPTTLQQGQKEFQKQWGKRKNEDNWRYSNKEGLPVNPEAEEKANAEVGDTPPAVEVPDPEQLAADSIAKAEALKDSLENDPHQREYYLKDIPFTEEQLKASNDILAKGLYQAGILEQERLENFPRAKRTLERLLNDFPEHENKDNTFYHLFLLSGRLQEADAADYYRQQLLDSFPESKYALTVGNPNYELLARKGAELEDSVYAAAYDAYTASDYAKVEDAYRWYTENFDPAGKHHARMLFVRAMSNLYAGQRDTFMTTLKEVIKRYPKDQVTELANAITKGLKEGRTLMSERLDENSIWRMRTREDGADTTQTAPVLKEERFGSFAFVLAYPTGSLDEDQLVFEMARYNFTNFMVRNFDLELTTRGPLTFMIIKGFQSYDEVHAYAQLLYADEHMAQMVKGIRTMLISEENLQLIGTDFSFDEYKDFQEEKLTPIEVPEDLILDEPTDLEIIDPEEMEEETETEEGEEEEEVIEDDFPFGF